MVTLSGCPGQRWHKTVGFFVFRPPSHYIFAHSMYHQQSQRGQNYTFCTQAEWLGGLTPMNDTPSSLTAASSELEIDVGQLEPADFADSLCNTLGLNAKLRSDLHMFLKLLKDLSRSQTIPMIYQMATNFYTQQLILNSHTDYTAIAEVLNKVKIALAQNLDLTKEQRTEVTAACKLIMWDPKRTDYDNDAIRLDVTAHLKKHQGSNGFKPIFDSKGQARIKALNQFIGLQASYAKSLFRAHIKESLGKCVTLATTSGMRKLVGSTENITPVHAMRMVILQEASDLWIAEFDLST
ncbi:hypothetical protein B0H10DRAFT_2238100 [Mycena sp. CBHHK59/15]|nr:hypothetical protein B0H10DRAFT_2238100 [Mycena sp. CBHHK59/15]